MIKECNLVELAKNFQYFLFDGDGVLWEHNTQIGNSAKALQYLFNNKKSVFIITNNSYKSREDFIRKGKSVLGIDIPSECWYSTSRTTAIYLKEKFPEIKSAYVVGGPGIVEELASVGITNVAGIEDSSKKYNEKEFWDIELKDKKVDCVIVGLDPGFNYYKLIYAVNCIKRGCFDFC